MPLRQNLRLGAYLAKQKLRGVEKFPLVMELEPLFACNLKCAGCGKIQQPHTVLKQRMPVEQAVAAVEECGAPIVSIAGGEPLMHPQIDEIVRALLARKKIVLLCTNAVLMPKHLHRFKPHRNQRSDRGDQAIEDNGCPNFGGGNGEPRQERDLGTADGGEGHLGLAELPPMSGPRPLQRLRDDIALPPHHGRVCRST